MSAQIGGPSRGQRNRVLVMGAGFLGRAIARSVDAAGLRVTVLSRRATGDRRVLVGDAARPEIVADALAGVGTVVYCIGGLLPTEADEAPPADLIMELSPLLTLLEAARDQPGLQVLFLSSGGRVYGEPKTLPVPEDHPLAPRGSYAISKVTAEYYLNWFRERYGIRSTALRCANVYGDGQTPFRSQGLVSTLLASASIAGDRIVPVFGDGSSVRDYLHVSDLAGAVVQLVGRPDLPAALNIGSSVGTSIMSLVELVGEITGERLQLAHKPARASDLGSVVLDTSRLRDLISFAPLELRAGLTLTWATMQVGVPA